MLQDVTRHQKIKYRKHKIYLLIQPFLALCFPHHTRVLGQSDILIILTRKEEKHFNQILQFKFSISAYRYEIDSYMLGTHMYLLITTINSWLQNKQVELMKHIHASSSTIFQNTNSCLHSFHIHVDLNWIIGSTKIEKNELIIYLCL